MNAKRSIDQPSRRQRGIASAGRADGIVATLPRASRAGLVFAVLTGPGMLPGVYAQTAQTAQTTPAPAAKSVLFGAQSIVVKHGRTIQSAKGVPFIAPYRMGHEPINVKTQLDKGASAFDVARYRNQLRAGFHAPVDSTAYLNALIQRNRMPATPVTSGSSTSASGAGMSTASVPLRNSAQARSFAAASAATRTNIGNTTGVWYPMGPYRRIPAGAAYQGVLPVAGRVNGIDYAKDKTGIFYLATATGGVWKWDPTNADGLNSTNSTVDSNWTHFSDTQFPTPETSCVAVDPNDHRVAYVGMGDYDGSGVNPAMQVLGPSYGVGYGLGMMKTVNGGATWYNIANGNPLTAAPGFGTGAGTSTPIMEGTAVSAIVINPTNSKNLIATSGRGVDAKHPGGIWVSNDAGNSWTRASISTTTTVNGVTTTTITTITGGNWSSLSASNIDGTVKNLVYYATREDDGVYSSPDGTVWTKLNVPLVFNGANNGEGVVGIKVVASKLPRLNNLTNAQRVLYVVDASETKNDGRIFKSVDGGVTWSDITGTYPAHSGQNNPTTNQRNTWGFAQYSLNMNSALVPAVGNSSVGATLRTLMVDLLSVGSIEFAASSSPLEPTGATGPKYLGNTTGAPASQVPDPGASPDFLYPDNFYYPDPITALSQIPNSITHGYMVDPSSQFAYQAGTQSYLDAMLLTDGGIYQSQILNGIYGLNGSLGYLYYVAPDDQILNPATIDPTTGAIVIDPDTGLPELDPTINDNLVVSQMLNGDFSENGDSISVRASTVGNTLATTDDALTPLTGGYPSTYQPDWASISSLTNPQQLPQPVWSLVTYALNQTYVTGNDQGSNSYTVGPPDGIYGTNPDFITDGYAPRVGVNDYPTMDTISISPFDLTGGTQFMMTSAGSGAWTDANQAKRLYYTTSNWQAVPTVSNTGSNDVTPDQQEYVGPNGALYYIYNTVDPQDGVTGPNWRSGYHTRLGMPVAWDLAPNVTQELPQWIATGTPFVKVEQKDTEYATGTSPAIYVGDGQYLWRFDPPGSLAYPPQAGPIPAQPVNPPYAAPAHTVYYPFTVGPNQDHGIWRQMNTTILAGNTEADHISAIGVVPGTGTVYVGTTTGTLWVCTDDDGNYGADVEGTGVGVSLPKLLPNWYKIAGPGTTSNLPNRPITSISVNFDPNLTTHAYGDILVTLGGPANADTSGATPRVGRVWRATNATGALPGVPTFVNTSGTIGTQTYSYLPDVTVYDIARDLDDPSNTYYAATDVGVFATTDAGSTWTNATAPLGLPNVAVTRVKVLENANTSAKTLAVTTFGRGAWGFDLTNIAPVIAKPNLIFSSTYNRTGNTIVVNLKITDYSTSSAPAGTAYNVILKSANLVGQTGATLTGAFTNQSNPTTSVVQPTTTATGGPIVLGNIGQNQTAYVTLYFNAANIRTGTLGKLVLSGTNTLPPIPPGTTATFSSSPALSHLP